MPGLNTSKTLYMLIGPKGSGKTTIGTLVHRHTDITFIRGVADLETCMARVKNRT